MILDAIKRAYQIKEERNWYAIYWAIDLHGTCLKSNYVLNSYEWINEDARICMEYIMHLPESKVIIWTSTHYSEKETVKDLLEEAGWINYWNCNPEVRNTETGCFDEKFYFSILLDDKAGFNPDTDWKLIYEYLKNKNESTTI